MKVLWIEPFATNCLSSHTKAKMAAALQRLGYKVSAVVFGPPGSWKTEGFTEIHYVPSPSNLVGKLLNQVRYMIRICRYDGDFIMLGADVAYMAKIAAIARRFKKRVCNIIIDVRTLPTYSGSLVGGADRMWRSLQIGVPHAHGLTFITEGVKAEVLKRLNLAEIPTAVWETGVDESLCKLRDIQQHEGIAACGHSINLLYLGIVPANRGIEIPIKAMRELRNGDHDYGLHIVGTGPALKQYEALVKKLGLEACVHLWGAIPYSQVPQCIAACDVGILTLPDRLAWNTSSPIKLFEYMAFGKPVIVSDIAAHRNLLSEQAFAFFMPTISPAGFCEAVTTFSALSDVQRKRLGQAAREFVKSSHTWDHRAQVLVSFLETIRQ